MAILTRVREPHPKRQARPIAPKAHPLARRLFQIAARQQTAITDIAERSGLALATLVKWKYRHAPTVTALEAALNVLGYELTIQLRDPEERAEREASLARLAAHRERTQEAAQ